ncbi:hypothetical protein KR009_011596 [Drosophila setifemur]|nr:hypothetical protein KR009_011596 [Drosophila setifemur]
MGNQLSLWGRNQSVRNVDHVTQSRVVRKQVKTWPFWRVIYWLGIFILLAAILVGAYFTLEADFGECTSYDVRCD